jgi:hypothetical protein
MLKSLDLDTVLLLSFLKPKWEVLQGISLLDILLIPPLIGSILFFAYIAQQKLPDTDPAKRYLLPGLISKIVGGLAFAAIYNYYYAGGDTFWYYDMSSVFRDSWRDNPLIGIKLFFLKTATYTPDTWEYTSQIWTLFFQKEDGESIFMAKLIGLVEGVGFESYWLTTILFATFSFTGIWKLFRIFVNRYPSIHRPLAISILFVPSAIFWGSGILKDTVCLGALGWFVYAFDRFISNDKRKLRMLLIALLMMQIIIMLKAYIILAFVPAGFMWIYSRFKPNSDGILLKYALLPVFIVGVFAFSGVVAQNLASVSSKYDPSQLERRAEGFRTYHTYLADRQGQSYYSLGDISYTPLGILSKAPSAINVAYFRPYPWEVNEPLQYISSAESLVIFLYFLFVFYKIGVRRFFRVAFSNAEATMCLIYAAMFGIMVGLTAYNFGALVRFKIPGVPFLLAAIAIVYAIGWEQIQKEKEIHNQVPDSNPYLSRRSSLKGL